MTCQTIFSQSVHTMHCSQIHKFYFSATFSLKMGLTVLFTHFTVFFSFQFQFSAFGCIQTNPKIIKLKMQISFWITYIFLSWWKLSSKSVLSHTHTHIHTHIYNIPNFMTWISSKAEITKNLWCKFSQSNQGFFSK